MCENSDAFFVVVVVCVCVCVYVFFTGVCFRGRGALLLHVCVGLFILSSSFSFIQKIIMSFFADGLCILCDRSSLFVHTL